MSGHPQFDEDLELYALGSLDSDERLALELHLRECAECDAKLEEANGRIALLALAAPPAVVPSTVRERLLRQVNQEVPKVQAGQAPAFRRWLTVALALAALVLLIVSVQLKLENRALRHGEIELDAEVRQLQSDVERQRSIQDILTASDTVKVTLVSGAAALVPEGRAFYHPRRGLIFYAFNLPELPSSRTYQLWMIPVSGNPISAGTFSVDARGNGEVLLPSLPQNVAAKAFAVTREPAGGVPQPTGPRVLVGGVS